jgi:hypothetical protein
MDAARNEERLESLAAPVEPSAVNAAERAVEAAQRIVVDRIELIRLEAQEALTSLVVRTGLMIAAGVVILLGWSALAVAAALWLSTWMLLPASLALVGAVHVLAGAGFAAYAAGSDRRRTT